MQQIEAQPMFHTARIAMVLGKVQKVMEIETRVLLQFPGRILLSIPNPGFQLLSALHLRWVITESSKKRQHKVSVATFVAKNDVGRSTDHRAYLSVFAGSRGAKCGRIASFRLCVSKQIQYK